MESLIDIDNQYPALPEGETRDDGEGMWSTYIRTFDEYDKRITNAWKEDATGLLVFTGLFSAVVGAFIIESYKKLSPNSGDQTVVLLGQISQQLVGFMNGTIPNPPASQQPSHPSLAIIAVNAMWLMSLVLSITSALFATSLQQWARRYIQTPQVPTSATHRARVRAFLFLGTQEYRVSLAVQAVPTLLHLSVFLFFAGIVVFFFTIHKAVAIAVSVSVGVFAVMYIALTILPYLDDKCPYRTPMSDLCWYPWNAYLTFAAICLRWILETIHAYLIPDNLGQVTTPIQRLLLNWLEASNASYRKHWVRLQDGSLKSIIQGALSAPVAVDRDALTRLFRQLALADESKLQKFVAGIPRDKFIHIMTPPIESSKIVFREPLIVIRNNVVDKITKGLDEDERKSCLLLWLAAIHHIVKEFFVPNRVQRIEPVHLSDDVRINFANISHMRAMWDHKDTAIRITSRSICALLAKDLLKDELPHAAQLRWLEAVTGVEGSVLLNSWGSGDVLNHVLVSFVCGIFPHYGGDFTHDPGDLPTAHASSITTTLAILMDAGVGPHLNRRIFTTNLSDLVRRMEGGDAHARFAANKLRRIFPDSIEAAPPVFSSDVTADLATTSIPHPSPEAPVQAVDPISRIIHSHLRTPNVDPLSRQT